MTTKPKNHLLERFVLCWEGNAKCSETQRLHTVNHVWQQEDHPKNGKGHRRSDNSVCLLEMWTNLPACIWWDTVSLQWNQMPDITQRIKWLHGTRLYPCKLRGMAKANYEVSTLGLWKGWISVSASNLHFPRSSDYVQTVHSAWLSSVTEYGDLMQDSVP